MKRQEPIKPDATQNHGQIHHQAMRFSGTGNAHVQRFPAAPAPMPFAYPPSYTHPGMADFGASIATYVRSTLEQAGLYQYQHQARQAQAPIIMLGDNSSHNAVSFDGPATVNDTTIIQQPTQVPPSFWGITPEQSQTLPPAAPAQQSTFFSSAPPSSQAIQSQPTQPLIQKIETLLKNCLDSSCTFSIAPSIAPDNTYYIGFTGLDIFDVNTYAMRLQENKMETALVDSGPGIKISAPTDINELYVLLLESMNTLLLGTIKRLKAAAVKEKAHGDPNPAMALNY